jgi:exodeoxyribonuclease-3
MYADAFAKSPVVMMGDFNSNAIWNKEHPSAVNHEAMVERLRKLGLVSAYHQHRGIEHGAEPMSEHTFHLYGHEDKSYHIDYCFLPAAWAKEIDQVYVGSYVEWHKHSDHRPLVVSVRDEA